MTEKVDANQIKKGMKLELDDSPFNVTNVELVKPGKGQSFTRTKLKNLRSGFVVERTFKSNESVPLADVEEVQMNMLYRDSDSVVFINDQTFDQVSIHNSIIGDSNVWLMENQSYSITFYKGDAVDFSPPTFLEMVITETAPGERGDTSGRVLKSAKTETGANIFVPIFIQEGEKVKVDTRTGEYVSRA